MTMIFSKNQPYDNNIETKKILYYDSGTGYGGSSVSLFRLIKHLDRKRFHPFIFLHGVGPKIECIKKMGVSVNTLSAYQVVPSLKHDLKYLGGHLVETFSFYSNFTLTMLINTLIITKFIKRHGINLVHLNNGIFENFSGLIGAVLCRIPCVSHIRGTEPLTKIERIFGGWVNKIITLNSVMNNLYSSVFGADKSCIIFNGVDLDAFEHVDTNKLRHEYQIEADNFIVGTVARLIPGKGIPEFIKAAAEVIKVNRKVVFFIVGDDPNFSRSFEYDMKQLAFKFGIGDHVVFTGWRNDVIEVMSGLDLVVQVSTFPEGMSLTPIEAMALGKPVITSDVPGYTDTIEHEKTGFIVPSFNISILAKEILRLAKDKGLAAQLGTNGQQKVLREFDVRITVKKIQDVYLNIFNNMAHKKRNVFL